MLGQLSATTKKRTFWNLIFSSQILIFKYKIDIAVQWQAFNIFCPTLNQESWYDMTDWSSNLTLICWYYFLSTPMEKVLRILSTLPPLIELTCKLRTLCPSFTQLFYNWMPACPTIDTRLIHRSPSQFHSTQRRPTCRIFCANAQHFLLPATCTECKMRGHVFPHYCQVDLTYMVCLHKHIF